MIKNHLSSSALLIATTILFSQLVFAQSDIDGLVDDIISDW